MNSYKIVLRIILKKCCQLKIKLNEIEEEIEKIKVNLLHIQKNHIQKTHNNIQKSQLRKKKFASSNNLGNPEIKIRKQSY